ncbi:o-succinylbenzoate synthase [Nesterenkonia muleiensis]|uniref:o-succinylbenzoate synthase n=1 Tax=Nesterenkonia muleiensis TaxID=2282648 RepID=UPI000E7665E6|nr:o-succinylbenzoate synthase [Nesterenkonia muleiensis]
MKLISLRLHMVELPLVATFTTSFSTQTRRECFLVEGQFSNDTGRTITGWGENVALPQPFYSAEYTAGAADVIRRWLAPALFAADHLTAETVTHQLRHIVGHPMAKAALEMAVLDAQLRLRGQSFAEYLGAVTSTVPSGVSVGIQPTVAETLKTVANYVEQGYARIKLKIKPGYDLEHVAAVRKEFGNQLPFQVDANAAYTLTNAPQLRRLDEYGLLLIEQPLSEHDLRQHAQLAQQMTTPICLDESVESAQGAADAIQLGAAAVINIKPGRVGGYLEARRIHDLARAHGVAVWCGGMLETGVGRAANAALAALPGFTLPGDISGSDRFYAEDIVAAPIRMHDGWVDVPQGPGFGVEVDREQLRRFSTGTVELTP